MPDAPGSIFISYAHADSAFAEQLEADLRQRGFDTWLDRRSLTVGQRWRRKLQQAMDRTQIVLVVLSPEALASDYVQAESQSLLDRLFDGQLAPLVAHFAETRALQPEEIARLKKLIAELDGDD